MGREEKEGEERDERGGRARRREGTEGGDRVEKGREDPTWISVEWPRGPSYATGSTY